MCVCCRLVSDKFPRQGGVSVVGCLTLGCSVSLFQGLCDGIPFLRVLVGCNRRVLAVLNCQQREAMNNRLTVKGLLHQQLSLMVTGKHNCQLAEHVVHPDPTVV